MCLFSFLQFEYLWILPFQALSSSFAADLAKLKVLNHLQAATFGKRRRKQLIGKWFDIT
jgi:hypothetical protein